MKNSISLIGLPGAGKSTLGLMLANMLDKPFIDTDVLIEEYIGTSVGNYINSHGTNAFKKIEEEVICNANLSNSIISTGGSVIYSNNIIEKLKHCSLVIYIDITVKEALRRIALDGGANKRGIVLEKNKNIDETLHSRQTLYLRNCDISVSGGDESVDVTFKKIQKAIHGREIL